jgi:hypothetical protein
MIKNNNKKDDYHNFHLQKGKLKMERFLPNYWKFQ